MPLLVNKKKVKKEGVRDGISIKRLCSSEEQRGWSRAYSCIEGKLRINWARALTMPSSPSSAPDLASAQGLAAEMLLHSHLTIFLVPELLNSFLLF